MGIGPLVEIELSLCVRADCLLVARTLSPDLFDHANDLFDGAKNPNELAPDGASVRVGPHIDALAITRGRAFYGGRRGQPAVEL